jgi:hypothetical protein
MCDTPSGRFFHIKRVSGEISIDIVWGFDKVRSGLHNDVACSGCVLHQSTRNGGGWRIHGDYVVQAIIGGVGTAYVV